MRKSTQKELPCQWGRRGPRLTAAFILPTKQASEGIELFPSSNELHPTVKLNICRNTSEINTWNYKTNKQTNQLIATKIQWTFALWSEITSLAKKEENITQEENQSIETDSEMTQ